MNKFYDKDPKQAESQKAKSCRFTIRPHGSALVRSDPHESPPDFEVCQMKGTHIGFPELTLFKSYEIGLLRIRPLCFWSIR